MRFHSPRKENRPRTGFGKRRYFYKRTQRCHKIGFEGGQMPLQRRVPKFGFKNINRIEFKAINISMLQELAERDNLTAIDKDILIKAGLLSKNDLLKILGNGVLKAKLEVKADAFSKKAVEAIEAAGGAAIVL